MSSELERIYKARSNAKWDLRKLVQNPAISLKFIESRSELMKNIDYYGRNPNCDMKTVMKYRISRFYSNIRPSTYSEVLFYHMFFPYSISSFTTYEYYLDHPEVEWNYEEIFSNPNFTFAQKMSIDIPISTKSLYLSINLTNSRDLMNNLDFQWNWERLSVNYALSIRFIMEHPELPWNMKKVDNRHDRYTIDEIKEQKHFKLIPLLLPLEDVTLELVMKCPDVWNRVGLGFHYGITLDEIDSHPELDFDYSYVSMRHDLTIDFIRRNINRDFDWDELSKNPVFTIEEIEANSDLPWVRASVLLNPNVTLEYVKKYKFTKEEIGNIALNDFGYSPYFKSKQYIKKMQPAHFDQIRDSILAIGWDFDKLMINNHVDEDHTFYDQIAKK